MRCSGQILRDGNVISEAVQVEIFDGQSGSGWKGNFAVPLGTYIDGGALYELILEDGRSAKIRVQGFYPSNDKGLAFFDGLGQLREGQSSRSSAPTQPSKTSA